MITFCIIDGQGGGIGATIIKKLREKFGESLDIIALGTNAIATSQMLKSRANKGASAPLRNQAMMRMASLAGRGVFINSLTKSDSIWWRTWVKSTVSGC